MTKRREPGTLDAAIRDCVAALGVAEASRAAGVNERYLRAASDPDDRRQVSLLVALKLDLAARAAGKGQPIFDAYAEALAAAPSGRDGAGTQDAFFGVAERMGPLAGAVADALRDGVIDHAEARRIADSSHAVMGGVRTLLDTLEGLIRAA